MYRIHSCLLALLIIISVPLTSAVSAQTAENDQEVRTHYTLYYENFKNQNYRDAVHNLVWLLYNEPLGYKRTSDVNFRRAIETFQGLADEEEDPAKKRAWLDSALVHYDRVIPVLSPLDIQFDPFIWTREKGRFIQTNINELADLRPDMITAYRSAYEMDPQRIDPYYLDHIVRDLYQAGDIGETLDFLRELRDKREGDESIEDLIRKYFSVIPPDEQIAFLEEQYEAYPDSSELVKQLFELYKQEALRAKMLGIADKVLSMKPSAATLREYTRMYVEDGDNERAIELFGQMQSLPDIEIVAQDYYNVGLAYQDMESFREARDHFRLAAESDPDFRQARVAIPHLYSTAVNTCGVADREQAAVFWLIADEYSRIGNQDGVNRMATAYPTAEDIFYVARWNQGESTQVSYTCRGMTISGTTTVRQRR